jgi:hypothetical protein
MPGYSGTPLPKKLGIKSGFRVYFLDAPTDVIAELKAALADCTMVRGSAPIDFAMVFTKSRSALTREFARISALLTPSGIFWISWPKKSSGVKSDVTENDIREIGLAAGLVDVKVCAVSEIWSGLKFVRRIKDR